MIVSFNPNITKKNNPPKMANNNPVAFKRNFNAAEIKGLKEGKASFLNNISIFIRTRLITAEDGAKTTLEGLIKEHPDKGYLSIILSRFP